jgi:hypothetical protein
VAIGKPCSMPVAAISASRMRGQAGAATVVDERAHNSSIVPPASR